MKVKDIFKTRATEGDIGVEIEVEGRGLPEDAKGWVGEMDGSLRGESREYVLRKPATLEELPKMLDNLKGAFEKGGSEFFEGYRAGTHVHINVQELTGIQLASMITGYTIFDKMLVGTCKDFRRGNHFCMRIADAPGQMVAMQNIFSQKDFEKFRNDQLRYSSMNITSLPKFGSLEFRSLESTYDFNKVFVFSRMHYNLREWAKTIENPVEVVAQARALGVKRMSDVIFKQDAQTLFFNTPGVAEFEEGLELAEEFAYCHKWGVKSLDIFSQEDNCW